MYSSYSSRTNGCMSYLMSYFSLLNTGRPQDTKMYFLSRIHSPRQAAEELLHLVRQDPGNKQSEAILIEKIQLSAWLFSLYPVLLNRQATDTRDCGFLLPSAPPHCDTGLNTTFLWQIPKMLLLLTLVFAKFQTDDSNKVDSLKINSE